VRNEEELREEMFCLNYFVPGMSYGDVLGMSSLDRTWYYDRLCKQKKEEAEMIKIKGK